MVTETPCGGLPLPHVPTKSWKSRPTASTVETKLTLATMDKFLLKTVGGLLRRTPP
jgi:hypothetical protein